MDINEMLSDDGVIKDALVMRNKVLMVENIQLKAKIKQLEEELANVAKPKNKRGKK